jgi:cytochrome c peroxidase
MHSSYKKVLLFGLPVLISILFFSFSKKNNYNEIGYIESNLTKLNMAFNKLDATADAYRNESITLDSLQQVFLNTREQYKKVEFFLAFYHPEYVNSTINGAPLLHIEKENTNPFVVNPEGLQVLDELIFSDEAWQEKHEIAAFAKKLSTSYMLLYHKIGNQISSKENDLIAMRLQLVRIFTLGITGFDTPGSVNAIADAKASFTGMNEFFLQNKYSHNSTKDEISNLFEKAIDYLDQSNSFETFDRLELLTKYIDPLYKKLGELHETKDLSFLTNITSWNPTSTSIFSKDFLNPYYFTKIEKSEDSDALRSLGKTLFFDPIISNDEKISCASCHKPEQYFTDAVPKSVSNVQGKFVLRNSPTLLNAVYSDRFFYDLRAFTLEQQAEHVIFNPDEFNTAYVVILEKLKEQKQYKEKFENVFGKDGITRENFSKALASYVLSLQSFNSSFDKYVRGETNAISQEAKNGFNLFMGKANCATCHFAPTFNGLVPPLFSENESEILGVLEKPNSNKLDEDEGRINNSIRSESAWIYEKSFKTVTVRNSEFTAPYFHNGAYQTLEDVIEFYNEGGGQGVGLSVQNQTLPSDKLNLTEVEKKELIAFIKVLNDNPYTK